MSVNLSYSNQHNLNKSNLGYSAVIDLLSKYSVESVISEDDLCGLNQSASSLRKALNLLIRDEFLIKTDSAFCDDCNCHGDADLICCECGKNLISIASEQTAYKILKSIQRSEDHLAIGQNNFFNSKVVAEYSNGKRIETWACIKQDEILLPISTTANSHYPSFFKFNDDLYFVISDEVFFPMFGNQVRHYHYSVIRKEYKIVQNNNFNNYGTIGGSVNQTNQINHNEASLVKIVGLLDLILENMDHSASNYAQNKKRLETAKNDQDFFSKTNAVLGFLSSVVTVAEFDLSNVITQIQKIIS